MTKSWKMISFIIYVAILLIIYLGFYEHMQNNKIVLAAMISLIIGFFMGLSNLELWLGMMITGMIGIVVGIFNQDIGWITGLTCLATLILFYITKNKKRISNFDRQDNVMDIYGNKTR